MCFGKNLSLFLTIKLFELNKPDSDSRCRTSPVVLVDHQRVGRPARWEGAGHQAAGGHHRGGHRGRYRRQRYDGRPADAVIPQADVHAGPSQGDGGQEVDDVLRQPPAVPRRHQEGFTAGKELLHRGQGAGDGQLQPRNCVWNLWEGERKNVRGVKWDGNHKTEMIVLIKSWSAWSGFVMNVGNSVPQFTNASRLSLSVTEVNAQEKIKSLLLANLKTNLFISFPLRWKHSYVGP